jgi:hypothetical protein
MARHGSSKRKRDHLDRSMEHLSSELSVSDVDSSYEVESDAARKGTGLIIIQADSQSQT